MIITPNIRRVLTSLLRACGWQAAAALLVLSAPFAAAAQAGFSVEGTVVQRIRGAVKTSTFKLEVAGFRYHLVLELPPLPMLAAGLPALAPAAAEPPAGKSATAGRGDPARSGATAASEKRQLVEIGSDGKDCFILRSANAMQIPNGTLAKAFVSPGPLPPTDQLSDPISQIIWLAYASPAILAKPEKGILEYLPGNVFFGEASQPVASFRGEVSANAGWGGLPASVSFFQPGRMFLKRSGFPKGFDFGKPGFRPAVDPSLVDAPLDPPLDKGYLIASFSAGEPVAAGSQTIPSKFNFVRYRPTPGASGAEAVDAVNEFEGVLTKWGELAAGSGDFLPKLAPGTLITDLRVARYGGGNPMYATSKGEWFLRDTTEFASLNTTYSNAPVVPVNVRMKRYAIVGALAAVIAIFGFFAVRQFTNRRKA